MKASGSGCGSVGEGVGERGSAGARETALASIRWGSSRMTGR